MVSEPSAQVTDGLYHGRTSTHLMTLSKLCPGGTGQFSMSHTTAWVESEHPTAGARTSQQTRVRKHASCTGYATVTHILRAVHTTLLVRCSGRAATGTGSSCV